MFGKKKSNSRPQIPVRGGGGSGVRSDWGTVEITPMARCTVNTAMATHIGSRSSQQDAAYVCQPLFGPGIAFGILCDGMGGMQDGERASSDTVAFMANRISAIGEEDDIPAWLEESARGANDLLLRANAKTGSTAGTTLAAAVIRAEELFWVNVGDSRIYIIRGEEIVQVSRDHNFALDLREMVDTGRITPEQAQSDPRREALISYIGAPVLEMADVNRSGFRLMRGDFVLLCSDGLTKLVPDVEILSIVLAHGGDLSGASRALTSEAFDNGLEGMDNTTVVLMQYLA